jgi:hypothetical protein
VTMVVMKLAAALETRTIGVGLGCHGGVTGKLDSISMGDVMLAAAGRRDVLLPTDFVVSQRRYRSARVGHCCWRGGRRFGPVDRVAMDGLAYGRRGVEVWREGEGAE